MQSDGLRPWSVAASIIALMMLCSSVALADDSDETLRIAVMEVPDGGDERVADTIADIGTIELMGYDDFVEQVESRAFNIDTILDEPSDLGWVMDGSDIDLIIDFVEESDEDYRVRFITAEDADSEHDFLADRGQDGSIRRGGAMVVRFELEEFLGTRPDVVGAAIDDATEEADDDDADDADDVDDERPAAEGADPEAFRRDAAADEDALKERLSRDWLWVSAHGRWFQRDFSAAAQQAVYTYNSGGFPGIELDVQAFPFGQSNPDMASVGAYGRYDHGFYTLSVTDTRGDEDEQYDVSVSNLMLEGGVTYRLDSPLDEGNRQLRFKLGGRYESFSVDDNPEVRSTALASAVVGTRLVLPIGVDEFAITAGVDVMPLAAFTRGEELFGGDSMTYGFGSELGMMYEVMENGFLSAGYNFRMLRSQFSDDGEPFNDDEESPLIFEDSEVFDLNQGLRAGFVYQY